LNQLVDFYEIRWKGHAIEGDLDAIIFNAVAATIPKWQTFKLVRWMQNLHQSTYDHEILYSDRSSEDEETYNKNRFARNQSTNTGGGDLKLKSCCVETTHEPLHLYK
jgi:hypothetical protein